MLGIANSLNWTFDAKKFSGLFNAKTSPKTKTGQKDNDIDLLTQILFYASKIVHK